MLIAPAAKTVKIIRSEDPCNPREDDDGHQGKMICFHGRYRLGDKHDWSNPNDFHNSKEFRNALVALPLYLYDHSGITMKTTPFSCPWDSGQVGYIYATMKRYTELTGRKSINKVLKERLRKELENEVKVYDQYLTGDVYDLEIIENGEVVDTFHCFYGQDWKNNGVMDYLPKELQDKKLWEFV